MLDPPCGYVKIVHELDTPLSIAPMADDTPIDKRTFTRQEMYDLVWSTLIQKLAERFGLSDRRVAKTCLRHQVPVPERSYWARIEAGQPA